MKNSLDNYLRLVGDGGEPISGNWPLLLNFIDSKSQKNGPNIAVIDFGGTTLENITEFFLHWGDTKAAALGKVGSDIALTGGHGNGGKFYMREMWRGGARFLTWKDGKSTSLIVDKEKPGTTGFWEHQDKRMTWKDALDFALKSSQGLQGAGWLFGYLKEKYPKINKELDRNRRGLTVLVGLKAFQLHSSNDIVINGRWDHQRFIDELREFHQSRRPIKELNIEVFKNGVKILDRLELEKIPLDDKWETISKELPASVIVDKKLAEGAKQFGFFNLYKAEQPLTGRHKYHNVLSVVDGKNNSMASYPIKELPLKGHSSILEFLFCDLKLIFPNHKELIMNEREKLVQSQATQKILEWVAEGIWNAVTAFEDEQKTAEYEQELNIADLLNDALNAHAKRFLEQLETEIFVDFVEVDDAGSESGDSGGGNNGAGAGKGKGVGTKGTGTKKGEKTIPGDTKKIKRPRFPEVLISGHSPDPSREDKQTKNLTDRHPPINQDDIDKKYNVWWINTSHPYAKEAMDRGGADGYAFKNYHLFLFIQVVQLESLRLLQRRQAELGLDIMENELVQTSNKFLSGLPFELVERILDPKEN